MPRRRWNRFRLRTILIAVAVLGCLFGWLGIKLRAAREQRDEVARIRELGGSASYDYEFDANGNMNLGAPPGPAWLQNLIGVDFYSNAVEVDTRNFDSKDDDLAGLCRLTHLRSLTLTDYPMFEAGLRNIGRLEHLKSLNLGGSRINDAWLSHLQGLHQLTDLDLSFAHLSDAGLGYLGSMTRLQRLWLNGNYISDAGLEHLKSLRNLRRLGIAGARITDAGLQCIDSMPALELLDSNFCKGVTREGVARLTKALPNLRFQPPPPW